MLQFILGTAGTGKTDYILKKAAELSRTSAKPVLLLVPEQASFAYEKQMLRMLSAKHADRVEVLSFSRLAETVLGSPAKPPIDEGGKTVLMSVALESMADRLSVYARYTKSLSVTNELLKLSAEFKRCMLSPAALHTLALSLPDSFLKQKLTEISLVLEAYDALVAARFTDDTDSLTRLYAYLADTPYFAGRSVCVDAFSGFTVQEYGVLERVLMQAKDVYVTLCTDSLYTSGSFDPSAFAYLRRTADKLMHAARRHDVHIATPVILDVQHRFTNAPLSALERALATAQYTPYDAQAPQITVVRAADIRQECAYIAASVKRLLREEQLRCREIAVLFRNAETYEEPMRAALQKCGVPVFEDKRQSVLTQPLIVLVRGLCAVAAEGLSTDSIMQVLKTGLLGFDSDDTAVLENYALLWDLHAADWRREFTANPEGLDAERTEQTEEQLARLNALREQAVQPLVRFADAVRDTDGRTFAEQIFRFLERMDVPMHLRAVAETLEAQGDPVAAMQQERVWDMLMQTLDMFAVTLGTRPVTTKRFAGLLDMVLRGQTLGSIPQGLDEVSVGSVDRTVPDRPRVVFVPGVHEGEFPRLPSSGGLLTDAERMQLRNMDVELYDFGEVKFSEERYLVYKTLCSPSERLVLTTCSAAEDGSAHTASEIIRNVCELFPQCRRVSVPALSAMELIESDETAFEQLCLQSRGDRQTYAALRAYFSGENAYAGRLLSLDRVLERKPFQILDGDTAEKLFGRHMIVSASRVENYHQCPFAYFCKFGLKAKPRKKAEFGSNIQGTLVHYVLETVLRQYGKDGLLAMTADERTALVEKELEMYLADTLRDAVRTERFLYLYRRFGKTISEILERLVLEFSVCRFEPVDFELKIDRDGDVPPYRTTIDEGGSVQIRGSVDRVDKLELDGQTYIRVIDYKSGSKEFRLSDALGGLNLQMLLYLFAIWQNGDAHYTPPITPAGILYMPARAKFEDVARDAAPEDAALQKARALRMNGLLIDREIVLVSMDENQNGCFIPWDNKRRSKSLISLRQLSELEERTQALLRQMALELRHGNIPALPSKSGKHEACAYCDYRAVCGIEDTDPRREIQNDTNAECLKQLDSKEDTDDAVDR